MNLGRSQLSSQIALVFSPDISRLLIDLPNHAELFDRASAPHTTLIYGKCRWEASLTPPPLLFEILYGTP